MKVRSFIYMAFASVCLFSACDPIEDTYELGGVLSEQEVSDGITVQNEENGNNKILLRNNLDGIGGLWDYGSGKTTFKNFDAIVAPGEYKVTFHAFCDGGTVTVTKNVTVTNVVYPLGEEWSNLCGDPGAGGKTWVWATGNPNMGNNGTSSLFGNGGEFCTAPEWWKGDAAELGDAGLYDEMHFTYTGVTLIDKSGPDDDGESTSGKFILDKETKDAGGNPIEGLLEFPFYPMGLKLDDPDKFPTPYKFELVTLTADEMTLRLRGGGGGEGWSIIYLLKRKGYEYDL